MHVCSSSIAAIIRLSCQKNIFKEVLSIRNKDGDVNSSLVAIEQIFTLSVVGNNRDQKKLHLKNDETNMYNSIFIAALAPASQKGQHGSAGNFRSSHSGIGTHRIMECYGGKMSVYVAKTIANRRYYIYIDPL